MNAPVKSDALDSQAWSADVWHAHPVPGPPHANSAGRARADALLTRANIARQAAWADKPNRQGLPELAVAEALAPLAPLGFSMMHDLHWPATGNRAATNVDHVLVGPAGVFVVDTIMWTGEVEVREGSLRRNGRKRDEAVRRASDRCRDLAFSAYLSSQTVQAVLCFTDARPAASGTLLDVDVVGLIDLREWILAKATQLDSLQIARIAARIRDVLPTRLAPSNVLPINPPLPGSFSEPVHSGRRRFRLLPAKRAS